MRRHTLFVVLVLLLPTTAQAQEDSTPAVLESLTVDPNEIDVSSGSQTLTVTAVITDDETGVCVTTATQQCGGATSVFYEAPGEIQGAAAAFGHVAGDTYTAEPTVSQAAEQGVWIPNIQVSDLAGNTRTYEHYDLVKRLKIKAELAVGAVGDVTERSVNVDSGPILLLEGRSSEAACTEDVPIVFQRRTRNGWRVIWRGIVRNVEGGRVPVRDPGRYRVTLPTWRLGTPEVTTCAKATDKFRASG